MSWIQTYLIVAPVAFIIGAAAGCFLTKYFFKKHIKEWQKKMEKPDKEQIRNMLSALGQKPSEEQVNRFINLTENPKKKKKPAKAPNKKKK